MDLEPTALWDEPVGEARASPNSPEKGKEVRAMITEDNKMVLRVEDGSTITLNKADLGKKLEALRERHAIFQEARMTGVLTESELTEISRDFRLLDVGKRSIFYRRTILLERKAAFEIFTKLKTEYPEAGAQLNPCAVARAAGYVRICIDWFSNTFLDAQVYDYFHLDVYILRACDRFWAPPAAGKPDGYARRLNYIEDDGIAGLARELTKELRDKGELIKPSRMTQQIWGFGKGVDAYHSTALSITLARKLKVSVNNKAAFDKWRGSVDECSATDKFSVPQDVWARFQHHFPSGPPQPETIEIMDE